MKAKVKISINGKPHSTFEQEVILDSRSEIMRINFDTPITLSGEDVATLNYHVYDEQPKHQKKGGKRKRFGVEWWSDWLRKWYTVGWYLTEKDRDKAIEVMQKRKSIKGYSGKFRRIER